MSGGAGRRRRGAERRVGRAAGIGVAALALAAAARAEPPAQAVRLPPLRPGAVMQYAVESHLVAPQGGRVIGVRRWTFDLQVMDATAAGGRVVYTVRSEALDGVYASGEGFLEAMKDTPIEFAVGPDGWPLRIENWAAVEPRAEAAVSPDVRGFFDSSPEGAQASVTQAVTETVLYLMADAQPRTSPIAPGHTVLYSDRRVLPDVVESKSIDLVGVDPAACRVSLRLDGTATAEKAGQVLTRAGTQATATVSTADGWLVSYDQTQTVDAGPMSTISIRRTSPAGCSQG